MKQNPQRTPWLALAACGLMLAGLTNLSQAQNTNPTNSFDSASSTTSFVTWWGPPNPSMTWDATRDAANDSASGSVRYDQAFTGAGGQQFMTFFTIANRWGWDFGYLLDATTYTNLSFDIKVDPSSGQRKNANDFGWLEVGLCTGTGPGTTYLPGRSIPLSATNWTHFNYPLTPSLANIHQVSGFFIKMWSNGDHTNTLSFNLDNFMVTKPTAPVIIPPPTVSLLPAKTKLNLLASGTGQYDRQQIRTTDSTYGWVGSTAPVTYEMTIKDSPGAANPYYQAQIFLVSNDTDGSSGIDWNATNLLFLHIENLANGGAQATFRYKTNRPGGNDMLFNGNPAATNNAGVLIGVGALARITSTSILGSWKLTIANDTNITVVAADGTSTNLTITPDAAALFSGSVRAFFGGQPGNLSYGGLGYAFDRIKISTPSTTMIEDDFSTGTLDTAKWTKQAADNAGVFVVPTNSTLAMSWTLPANGFIPQIGTNITPGSTWKSPVSSDQIKIQTSLRTYLASSELNPKANYFRLLKRVFYQLQVLMPGESNAPGTPTGKTGTPAAQAATAPFDVTVLAVDANWYPITSTSDTVHFTSTDGSASLPGDAALVNGSGTFGMFFGSSGSWTVTASDVTDPTKLSHTGSSTTVP